MNSIRFFLFGISVVLLVGCNFTLAADITPPPGYQDSSELAVEPAITSGPLFPLLPPDPSKGEAIYAEKCSPCHGPTGLGDGPQGSQLPNPVPALGSFQLARQAKPARWYGIVTQGNLERFMPPFPSLSDRQRWDVTAFILRLSTPPSMVAEGEQLYEVNCANCHGLKGNGKGPDGGDNLPDFTDQELMAGRSAEELYNVITKGAGTSMLAYSEKLKDEERWALTAYLRSLSFRPGISVAQNPPESTPVGTQTVDQPTTNEITPTLALSQAKPFGSISGKVVNGTSGNLSDGLIVNLHGFDQTSMIITGTVPLQGDGTFAFESIEMPEGRIFLASVKFQGVTYASEAITVENNQLVIDLPIQVYEPTTDHSILKVDRLHYFFEPIGEDSIRIVELYIISNPSGKTLVAPDNEQAVLNFQIPNGSTNLQIQDGELGKRFILTKEGFGDTIPIRPGVGSYQLLFSYDLTFKRTLDFVRPINLSVNAIVILVPEKGLILKGDALQDGGIREVQGMSYHLYNGIGVQPGNDLRMTISRSNTFLSSGTNSNLFFGLSALGIVLVISGFWLYRRNKISEIVKDAGEMELPSQNLFENREALMDAILALDDLFQDGKLPEEAYLRRRTELKTRLKELVDLKK